MKSNVKFLGLGLLGGMLPLGAFLMLNGSPNMNLSDTVLGGDQRSFATRTSLSGATGLSGDFVQASENSINSVVHVTTKVVTTNFQRDLFSEMFYGPGAGGKEFKQYGSGSGSGVIVSADGYIVTNNHVIENASEIEVILNDNSKYKAKLIATDPSTDIAVLKIEGKNLQPIVIGNSDDVKVGEWVLAVGNPFNLTSTVTAGIVSAKARNINLLSDRTKADVVPIESFIQTDAAVNPGNSGGALVNTRGELIGINTAIQSQTGSYAGYAFAIPVNLVQKVLSDLIDFGIVQRAFLGVQIADITQELKEKNNLPNLKGVLLAKVNDGGSADDAGLKDNDVILKIGTQEVNSVASLQEEVGKKRPGDKITITIRNKNNEEEVKELILRNSEGDTKLVTKTEVQKNMALGATFVEATDKEKKELSLKNGVKIKTLNAGKLKSQGLTEGMIITKVNNELIQTVEQLTNKLNQGSSVVWLEVISATGQKLFVGFEI